MKKIKYILLFVTLTAQLFAQYGNEWIDYSRPHFRITVTSEGIYRISGTALNSVGLNFIAPQNFRIFRDGQQIPIYVDATGNTVNFIEFYAYPNDGKNDTRLYRNPDWQMHDFYSLFSNDAIYYLTFNNSGGNLRLNETPNNLTNLPARENFFMHTERRIFTNDFNPGQPFQISGGTLHNSIFTKGEGFYGGSSHVFNNSTLTRTYNLNTPHKFATGPAASVKTVVVGTSNNQHHYQVVVSGSVVSTHLFSGYELVKSTSPVPISSINNSTAVTFQSIPTSTGTNRNFPSLIEISYPRIFNFDNSTQFAFRLQGNGNRQYLELQNFNDQGTLPVLYDLTNGYRIVGTDAPGAALKRFALPAATGERQLFVRSGSAINVINTLTQQNFVNFNAIQNQGNYIILSHPTLMATPEFQEYVAYRRSMFGGGFSVAVVDVNQLYHQFSYGVDRHPLAVMNFVSFAKDRWSFDVEHIFIIGKGREYKDFRTNNNVREACFVPTFGNPGSDNVLVADVHSSIPKLAVGRLAAINGVNISRYLEKVKQYETELRNFGDPYQKVDNKEFMKQILHFGGGNIGAQQQIFQNYLNNYKNIIQDTLWGANVYSVFKTSSSPLQNVQSDVLRQRIDKGVSLITFFGHSYAGGFDISFDEPENYTNVGKYPIFLANGCNAGLIHAASRSISERFVLAEQKGAIAYISTTDLSSSTSLNNFSFNFYNNLARHNYQSTIGKIMQATIANIEACCSNFQPDMMVAQEMTLHGDPAIGINQYQQPDYAIEAQNVFFSPQNVTTAIDSFEILLDVYNLGKAIRDSFNVQIARLYPDGTQEVFVKRFPAPNYRDTLVMRFQVSDGFNGLGLNRFNIHIDSNNEIPNELSETNNYLMNEVSLVIGSDDIFPIYPYEFSIVPKQNVILKASTGDPFAPVQSYTFQIDTSELFVNPLAEGQVVISGGVVKWQPPVSMVDSTVYYWRVASQSGVNENKWQYSSFIYIANEFPGWNQSHYFQWKKDDFQNIEIDANRRFKYVDDRKDVFVQTGNVNYNEMKFEINGSKLHNWQMNNCGDGVGYPNGFTIVVIDHVSGLPREVINTSGGTSSFGPYGNIHCAISDPLKFVANFRAFGNTPAGHPTPGVPWSSLILNYLNNVPLDDYVIVYSINNPRFDLMDQVLLDFLNSRGAPVSNATSGPMILAYKENGLASALQGLSIGTSFNDVISVRFDIFGLWNSGFFTSTLIGPAQEWGSIHWRYFHQENPTSDYQNLEVYGVNEGGFRTLLFTMPASTLDTNITFINANQYPYLRLRFLTDDEVDRTPTQPKYWRVLYKEVPEIAINPNLYFEMSSDTVSQGDNWSVAVALENVSEFGMDSIWSKFSSKFGNNSLDQVYRQFDSLPSLDTIHLTYTVNTLDNRHKGFNDLTIEANPLDYNHQNEQFHFNNFAQLRYFVLGDNQNPLLDVTFDGVHILDGDLVSAKPEISIQLKDENKFLALDDTSLISIYFRYVPTGNMWRANYSDINVNFYPADEVNLQVNKANVVIYADFPQDGKYELIVRSTDKSGNTSSATDNRLSGLVYYDYKIAFEVVNKPSISNVLNYPNPFTTQTQFVFTLTGSEIPDYMEIQITNIKGTVVKQIRMDELGPIKIGLNRTQYAWDGRDQYGDVLANGVYFYKIITSLDNKEIDHYSIDQVDKFFKKGIGKMVLIR
jgi:hypothetical protein